MVSSILTCHAGDQGLIPWWEGNTPFWTSLVAQTVKRLSAMLKTQVRSLGREDPLEKEMVTHSSTMAWKIPWTEEPSRLQSMGSQRIGHDWVTSHCSNKQTKNLVVLGLFSVGLFLLLCFLPRYVPFLIVVKLVCEGINQSAVSYSLWPPGL